MIEAATQALPPSVAAALDARFAKVADIYTHAAATGYWSNIDASSQRRLLEALTGADFERAVREQLPQLHGFVFGEFRTAGLDLLNIQRQQVGIDLGCMWGSLLVEAARRCGAMVGVDKTREHLLFLQHRIAAEHIANVALLNADLRHDLDLDAMFDFAIVNGVLEWIPTDTDVDLSAEPLRWWSRSAQADKPRTLQRIFLARVRKFLKPGGALYLAIENRYDYTLFLWNRDPHTRLWFSAQAPRAVANALSHTMLGRPYVNYLYSARALEALLVEAGFDRVDKYVAFPNYRHPRLILPLERTAAKNFVPAQPARSAQNPLKRAFRRLRAGMDDVLFRRLGRLDLAPAFIFIAYRR